MFTVLSLSGSYVKEVRSSLVLICLSPTPSSEHIHWIAQSLSSAIAAAPYSLSIVTHIHATGINSETSGDDFTLDKHPSPSTSSNEKHPMSLTYLESRATYFKVIGGRPNISKIVNDEIDTTTGPMSVEG
jgi:hypothetical protein